jgi:hypothetical protein
MTELQKPSMDQLLARHEEDNPVDSRAETLAAAQLFNAVGTQLTQVDKMSLGDGGGSAMKLDKNAIVPQMQHDEPPPPRPSPYPPTPQHPPISMQAGLSVNTPTVTVDHKTYNQHIKKLETINRKLTKVDKELASIREVVSIPKSTCKYVIKTSNLEMTCRDPGTLLAVIAKELSGKVDSITLSKC